MTFEKLNELIEKHNIPKDVKLMSLSGHVVHEPNNMDGVYYFKEDNLIMFTQGSKYDDYIDTPDAITLFNKDL